MRLQGQGLFFQHNDVRPHIKKLKREALVGMVKYILCSCCGYEAILLLPLLIGDIV